MGVLIGWLAPISFGGSPSCAIVTRGVSGVGVEEMWSAELVEGGWRFRLARSFVRTAADGLWMGAGKPRQLE